MNHSYNKAFDAFLDEKCPIAFELSLLFHPSQPLVIFDIGACEGEDSLRYHRMFPNASIIAFEALPSNQKLITHNFERHASQRCCLVSMALSNQSGTSEFHVSSESLEDNPSGDDRKYGNKSSSLLPPKDHDPMHGWIHFKETVSVSTTTVSSFCESEDIPRINFIHMDVQGAEGMVLAGMGTRLLRKVDALWIETMEQPLYAGQDPAHKIDATLKQSGFMCLRRDQALGEETRLYVNKRRLQSWLLWLRLHTQKYLMHLRMSAGAIKHKWIRSK